MTKDIKTTDFFTDFNLVDSVNESDYDRVDILIEATKAFARSTYQCVYIVDYFRRDFLYMSDNISHLCDGKVEEIKNSGFRFYSDYMPEKDLKMLIEINDSAFKLFNRIPVGERKDYIMSFDLHLIRGGKNHKHLVNHSFTPLMLTKNGSIWLAMCTISLASCNEPGNVIMKKCGSEMFYYYSFSEHKWEECDRVVLTDNEREVLSLSTHGYTMNDIAGNINKSVDTVKAYKRSIFQKLGVKNIAEALAYAQSLQLI